MPDNIFHHFVEESKVLRGRLASSGGPARAILVHIAVVGVFGVLLPLWLGFQFLDPVTIAAYACLGVMFSAPAAAQAFATARPRSVIEMLARIAVTVLYGEIMAIAILAAGFITFFSTHSAVFGVDFVSLAEAAALGLSGSLAMAAIAAWISLRLSAGASRMAIRIIFLGLLMLFFFRSRWLPDVEVSGTLVCLGIAAVAMVALARSVASRA